MTTSPGPITINVTYTGRSGPEPARVAAEVRRAIHGRWITLASRQSFPRGWLGAVWMRIDGPLRDNNFGRGPLLEQHVDVATFTYSNDHIGMPAATSMLADFLRVGWIEPDDVARGGAFADVVACIFPAAMAEGR